MANTVFWFAIGTLYTAVLFSGGVAVGYYVRYLQRIIAAATIDSPVEDFEGPAIIDAKTPVELKHEPIVNEDEDSGIVVALTPVQLESKRQKKLDEELDKITGVRL